MKRHLVSFAFLFFVGCNNPTGIGGSCTANGECDRGQYCNTTAPGGFCTRGCSFEGGQVQECPSGSTCSSIGNGVQVCAALCTATTTCRDQYECKEVSGSKLMVCRPKS